VYFQALSDSITEFKNVTIIELIEHITTKYPPRQEEMNAVKATLREQWDPTNHIENLFQSVKQGTDTLLLMKSISTKEWDKTFIKYAYSAISNSGQFDNACLTAFKLCSHIWEQKRGPFYGGVSPSKIGLIAPY
jgi:hypothetical protein